MENLLGSLVLAQQQTTQAVNNNTELLGKIYGMDVERANIEKRRLNEEKRAARQAKKEKSDNILKKMGFDGKKMGKETKKSFLDSISSKLSPNP